VDLTLTPDQQAFRERVRTWLKANIPAEWKTLGSTEVPRAEAYELGRRWQRQLFEGGFIGITWPREYGGQGLTFMEEMILHE
jgi:alkylation response protein AidB-like acyl-CoA dehydrogenase